jgi:phage protein D
MNAEAPGRRTDIQVSFEGVDISAEMQKYLLSLSYTDNEEDEADDLQITLQDRDGIWTEQWLNKAIDAAASGTGAGGGGVETGLSVKASIIRRNWNGDGKDDVCDCGAFSLDSVECSGPPAVVTLRATALRFTSEIRQTEKCKSWESYNLSGIAAEMTGNAGMQVMFLTDSDPYYAREEQYKESDIAFLKRLCHNAGLSLKSYNNALVIFDQAAYEAKEPEITIAKKAAFQRWHTPNGDYLTWTLSVGTADAQYQSCRVSYNDPETGLSIEGIAKIPDYQESESNQRLEITAKVGSAGEALALAAMRLRLHNKYCATAEFTMPGNPALAAGVTVRLSGWGGWDGKYIIKKAVHTVDGRGYKTGVSLRRVLEGY